MSKSPKKADPTPVSEGEKIQAQVAKDQIAYYRGTYAPLEGEFAQEAGQDHTSRLSAQASSAGMREASSGLQQLALGSAPVDTAAVGGSLAGATAAAATQGRRARDDGRLSALGVGLGITADAGQSLSGASQDQAEAAIDKVREGMAKQQAAASTRAAAMGAVGTLAGAGLTYYGLSAQAEDAGKQSLKMGASKEGYGDKYLSGWKGVKQ